MKSKKLILQSLVFDYTLDRFSSKKKVKGWIKRNGYKFNKRKKDPIKKYKSSKTYRVRQKNPFKFIRSSFKRKVLSKGVIGVMAKKK